MEPADVWEHLTEGQGAVLAALVTILGGLLAIWVASTLFDKRIKSYEEAASDIQRRMTDENRAISAQISGLHDNLHRFVTDVNAELASITKNTSQTQAETAEIETLTGSDGSSGEVYDRAALVNAWRAIRDRLETLASNPDVDGRRRAKYARIDRRNYSDLIASLDADGALGHEGGAYRQAVEIWHKYRNGRLTPNSDDIRRLETLAAGVS